MTTATSTTHPTTPCGSYAGADRYFSEGDKVCCVARDGSHRAGRYSIWVGTIYQVVARKRDEVLQWRRVGNFGRSASGHIPSDKLVRDLRDAAPYMWLSVSHNQELWETDCSNEAIY